MLKSRSSQSVVIVVPEEHEFKVPQRIVRSPMEMPLWEKSEAYSEYLGFLLALNEAIKGKSNSVACPISENVRSLLSLLTKLDKLVDDIKPLQQPQRFGNQAFRQWYSYVKEKCHEWIQESLPKKYHRAIPEIMEYFYDGFGNSTRIDYGTGHELSFLMYVCCLFKIGALVEDDKVAVVSRIFSRYLEVVRKLQQTYRMEPAGSHGVWSLDDFQFVPFIWGSAQLIGHPKIEPSGFVKETVLDEYGHDYLFLSCIQYINKVKSGPFAEHSNQLWGISGVAHWSKINSGLIKMYKVEVLGKFPVIQHVVFGSLLPFKTLIPDVSSRDSSWGSLSTLSSAPSKVSSGSSEEENNSQGNSCEGQCTKEVPKVE